MYARMITAQLPPIEAQVVIPLPIDVLRELRQQPGLEELLVLTSHAEQKVVLISIWKTEAEMQAYEASQTYQQHRAKLEVSFAAPATQTSYDASFNIKHITTAAHTALMGGTITEPEHLSRAQPKHTELVRVIPVAQRQIHQNTELLLLSLEVYTDGFILQGRLRRKTELPLPPTQYCMPAHLHMIMASDDLGTQFHGLPQGGGGSEGIWRFSHAFTPQLDPAARELRLELPELRWHIHDRADHKQPPQQEVVPGPWTFTIPLTAGETK